MLLDAPLPIDTAPMGDMPPGSVFAGHRIEAVAGRGGMGVVYRARQLSLDRVVALKVIAPALTQDEAVRRRFLRESRAAASIDHPHVIPIYYAGEEDGVAYIGMRYVGGDDLRTFVRRQGPLDAVRAARIATQVAAALDAAHAAGLVHRDVKPANVLLGPGEHAYLTDFGLTKHVLSDSGATRSGHWVGTLDFVAPEQIRGERVDARADVYALGCLLHYALAGAAPFRREGDEAKLWAHLSEPPERISATAPGVPAAFDDVIERALAKAPEDRFQSAGDLGRAAQAAAAGGRHRARDRVVATGAAAPIEVDTRTAGTALAPPDPGPADRRPRSRRRLTVVAAGAVVLLAGAAVLAAATLDGGDGKRRPAAATATPQAPRVTTARLGGRPNVILAAGEQIWTGAFLRSRLAAIDPARAKFERARQPEIGIGLTGMAARGRSLWALASRDRQLVRLDARTGRRIGKAVTLPGAMSAVAASRDSVWVTVITPGLEPPNQLVRIDPSTHAVLDTREITYGVRRIEILDGGLWLLASNPARLTRIDLDTGDRRHLELDADTAVDMAVGEGALWVTLSDVDRLARVDPRASRVTTTYAAGRSPAGVVVEDGSAWVANRDSSTLTRLDTRTGRVREEIEVPINPYDVEAAFGAVWVTSLATGRIARVRAPAG